MTTTASPAPGRLRTPRADRSHGQWAVDGRTPLNANEAMKQAGGGLDVRERIENVYAREGFASIPDDDLREAVDESYRLVVGKLPKKHRPEGWDGEA